MVDLITLVSGIEFRIRELISRYDAIQTENEQLKSNNEQLLRELDELKHSIKQLQYKNQIIKIAKAIEKEKRINKCEVSNK